MTQPRQLYGILAEFSKAEELVRASEITRKKGYLRFDAYAPFSVDGLDEAVGASKKGIAGLVLLAGIVGGICAYCLQYYCAAIGYPLNVGGRPLNSIPAFIPITFELTILFASLSSFLAALIFNGLPCLYHPLFNVPRFESASQDAFFLCIETADPQFTYDETETFLKSLEPRGLYDVPA